MSNPPSGLDAKGASKQAESPPKPPHLESYANYKEPYSKRLKRYCNRNLGRILVGIELSFAFALVVITGTYTYYAGGQLREMRKATKATKIAADAATSAADTAAKQLDMSERPWINPNIGIVSPITIDQMGLTLKIGVRLRNTGNSPATALRFQAETIALPMGPSGNAETIKERDRVCDVAKKEIVQGNDAQGETIFPNSEGVTRYIGMTMAKDEMDSAIKKYGGVNPMIVTCVAYLSTYKKTIRTTAEVFIAFRIDPASGNAMAFIPRKEGLTVDPKHIMWVPSPIAGVYAD